MQLDSYRRLYLGLHQVWQTPTMVKLIEAADCREGHLPLMPQFACGKNKLHKIPMKETER